VSKDDLWRVVWADVAVTDGVLAVCLTEIRQALGDDAKAPRFIETVHRRGYRFIASVATAAAPVATSEVQVPGQKEERQPAKSENGLTASVQNLESNGQGLASSVQLSSLDKAQRNPEEKPEPEPRIALRSIRATELPVRTKPYRCGQTV
jgi:DNA-binding winged helix-turn-helix (wHTH) protein